MSEPTEAIAVPQRVTRVGNLTKDPEIKMASNGNTYCRFRIASPQKKGPTWRDGRVTMYYNVVCFDQLAENVAESVKKGNRVIVEGRASMRDWTDKEGEIRKEREIAADAVGAELRFATVQIDKQEFQAHGETVLTPGEEPF